MMKQHYFSILTLFFFSALLNAQTTVDFNSTTDLTDNFNSSSGALFTNGTSGGISDTGAIDISTSNENWTIKDGITVVALETYSLSSFIRIKGTSGRGGVGFTINDTNTTSLYGHPAKTLGFSFHGAGGEFINNSFETGVSWPSILTQDTWYFIELILKNIGLNAFEIEFKIYNSDSNGVIGTLKASESFLNILNTDVGSALIIYPYFCHDGTRMNKLDNFTFEPSSTLSVDTEVFTNSMMMYPNPTQDFLQIAGLESEEAYKIYNTVGAQVAKGMVSNGKQIEIQNLTNGMYFLKLESGRTFKFLKE